MREEKVSFIAKVMLEMVISGVIWIGASFCFMWVMKKDTTVAKIALLSVFTCLAIIKMIAAFIRVKHGDEMSKVHYQQIRAESYSSITRIIIFWGIVAIVADLLDWTLVHDWFSWLLSLIGLEEIIMGIRFYRLEKKGEDF